MLHVQYYTYAMYVHHYPESKVGLEVVEDEVRECLWHGAHFRQVMSHDSIREREGCSRTVRQMTHHKTIYVWTHCIHKGSNHCSFNMYVQYVNWMLLLCCSSTNTRISPLRQRRRPYLRCTHVYYCTIWYCNISGWAFGRYPGKWYCSSFHSTLYTVLCIHMYVYIGTW